MAYLSLDEAGEIGLHINQLSVCRIFRDSPMLLYLFSPMLACLWNVSKHGTAYWDKCIHSSRAWKTFPFSKGSLSGRVLAGELLNLITSMPKRKALTGVSFTHRHCHVGMIGRDENVDERVVLSSLWRFLQNILKWKVNSLHWTFPFKKCQLKFRLIY